MGRKVRQSLTILVGLGLLWIISLFLYSLLRENYPATPEQHSLIKTTINPPALVQYRGTSESRHAIIKRLLLTDMEERVIHPTQSPQSYYKKQRCKSRICRHFLDKMDLHYFSYCWRKSKLKWESKRSVCHFLNAPDRAPVALASFPGSGNTWVRGLLQAATGVCTGAIYCDTTLRGSGFPGESLRSGKTLVVKTHQTDPRWTGVYYPPGTVDKYFKKRADIPVYRSAIFVIRNPFHALVAEWSRQMTVNMSGNHIITIGEKYYTYNKKWDEFVHTRVIEWQDTVIGWLINNHNHPVMVVKYEDLKRDILPEVMMILDFLEFPYSVVSIIRRLKKGYNEFRRKHENETFEHFTPTQQALLQTVIHNTIHTLKSHGLSKVCDITEYLRKENIQNNF